MNVYAMEASERHKQPARTGLPVTEFFSPALPIEMSIRLHENVEIAVFSVISANPASENPDIQKPWLRERPLVYCVKKTLNITHGSPIQRVPRTSLPGSAPVALPSRCTTWPLTMVAS